MADPLLSLYGSQRKGPSKEQLKKLEKQRQRERQIEAAAAESKVRGADEETKLRERLQNEGFTVHEIPSDGNCLFQAVAHQLSVLPDKTMTHTYQDLRKMTANYMREHKDQLMPFFLAQLDENNTISSDDPFEQHCQAIGETAAWGGELEVSALSKLLGRKIIIYGPTDITYNSDAIDNDTAAPIRLAFHRKLYSTGAHYNSILISAPNA